MRREPTPAERLLWQALRNQALGIKFRRQAPIGPYIVDFFCPPHRLVIEVDGETHAAPDADRERDSFLRAQGLRILRFWNPDITGNLPGVLAAINAAAGSSAPARGTRPPDTPAVTRHTQSASPPSAG